MNNDRILTSYPIVGLYLFREQEQIEVQKIAPRVIYLNLGAFEFLGLFQNASCLLLSHPFNGVCIYYLLFQNEEARMKVFKVKRGKQEVISSKGTRSKQL